MHTSPKVLVTASLGPRPYVGGIENVVDTLLESKLRQSFDFSIYDTYRAPDASRTLAQKLRYARDLSRDFARRLAAEAPDLVHIHFCSKVDFWKHAICLRRAAAAGIPTVFHLHGGSFDSYYAGMSWLKRRAAHAIFAKADRVVALSDYWRDFLAGFVARERIRVLNNPIDSAALTRGGPRAPDHDEPKVVLLGSLGRRKGHYEAVRAMPRIRARFPRVALKLAGREEDPGAREALAALARDEGVESNIEFLGPIGFEQKAELLRTCSVLILPSRAENMPISLLEGMAAGAPVVATRVGAVPEVLANGELGAVIAPGDADQLADAITEVLEDPQRAAATAEKARARARERWDVAVVADNVRRIYDEVLERT